MSIFDFNADLYVFEVEQFSLSSGYEKSFMTYAEYIKAVNTLIFGLE